MPRERACYKYSTEEERKQAKKASAKRWRDKNKERVSAVQKEYRESRKDIYAEHQKNWRKKNPEKAAEQSRKSKKKNSENNRVSRMLSAAKARAFEKDVPFNLTRDDIEIPSHCPVLNIELVSGSNETRPELDRIIPSLGYVKGNVKVISGRANRIKWNATLEELEAVTNYVRQSQP